VLSTVSGAGVLCCTLFTLLNSQHTSLAVHVLLSSLLSLLLLLLLLLLLEAGTD
jgi:hypothetical protein